MEIERMTAPAAADVDDWFAVVRAAEHEDRPHGWPASRTAFDEAVRLGDSPYRAALRWTARVDGETVGVAEAELSLRDNTHIASFELTVAPQARRRGVGSRLLDALAAECAELGRTVLCAELHQPIARDAPGLGFATKHGFASVHEEDHLVLPLPLPAPELHRLQQVAAAGSAYDLVVWRDRCPEEHLTAYVEMRNQMNRDVPTGEVDWEPVVLDTERQRLSEERLTAWQPIVAAARRRSDGVMGGYSTVFVPRDGDRAMQDDTLVMPEHRGARLGTALKLATLQVLQHDHPEVVALHTWTAPDNAAMQRTNRDFGYVARERLHEMQRSR